MATWLKAHLAKIIAALTTLHAILQVLGSSPIASAFGPVVGHVITVIGLAVTTLLSIFAPGTPITAASIKSALAGSPAAPQTVSPPDPKNPRGGPG